jgi:hypothetical protein
MATLQPSGGYSMGRPPLRGTRPKEVELSFWLWVATLVLSVLGALGVVLRYGQIKQIQAEMINRMVAQNPSVNQSMIERTAMTALVIVLVVWLLLVAAMFVFAFLMRGGRNWARVVLAVLGGLGVLFSLIGFAAAAGSVIGALRLLLLIGAIVTMFLPAANVWFAPRRPGF